MHLSIVRTNRLRLRVHDNKLEAHLPMDNRDNPELGFRIKQLKRKQNIEQQVVGERRYRLYNVYGPMVETRGGSNVPDQWKILYV